MEGIEDTNHYISHRISNNSSVITNTMHVTSGVYIVLFRIYLSLLLTWNLFAHLFLNLSNFSQFLNTDNLDFSDDNIFKNFMV